MPGAELQTESEQEALQSFVDALRASVGRLQDDAAIAVELNPESPALDDVHLVRDVIVAYAEKIMLGQSTARSIRELCTDDSAWSDVGAMRKKISDALGPLLE